jgi:2-polyprenyl-3-methyl-5-hydroxy-6-metoxy-1,4-benzoquinol methylase
MGVKQGVKFYDNAFLLEKYQCRYNKSVYFPMWQKIVKEYLPKGKILELGCGTGQFAHYLRDEGHKDYYGVDFSPVAIETARKFSNLSFGIANIEKDGTFYKNKTYDIVISLETLEHISDLEVFKRLMPNLIFIGSVPNFDCEGHVRHFTSMAQIINRYKPFINFDKKEKFGNFWIFKGLTK